MGSAFGRSPASVGVFSIFVTTSMPESTCATSADARAVTSAATPAGRCSPSLAAGTVCSQAHHALPPPGASKQAQLQQEAGYQGRQSGNEPLPLTHPAEHAVVTVQVGRRHRCYKELSACAWAQAAVFSRAL